MAPNENHSIQLKAKQHEYLKAMVEKYDLDDASKAVRILINYAIDTPDVESDIFDEIRCLDC
ncbi:MAG: hypothetical protein KDC38_15540 [Planctomycetes bacterium]|nr:hypothetical protein [Planctomycetota bacterium]